MHKQGYTAEEDPINLDPSKRERPKSIGGPQEFGLPFRDWLKGETIFDKKTKTTVVNDEVYYFFSSPRTNEGWLTIDQLDMGREAATGMPRKFSWVGTADPMPFVISKVPVEAAEIVEGLNGSWQKTWNERDPILSLIKPDGRWGIGKDYVAPQMVKIAAYINAEGEQRVMEFNVKDARLFRTWVDTMTKASKGWNIAGKPIRIRRIGSGFDSYLDIEIADDAEELDMTKQQPRDLHLYIDDLRTEVQTWLAERGLWSSNGPLEQIAAESTPPWMSTTQSDWNLDDEPDLVADLASQTTDALKSMVSNMGIVVGEKTGRARMIALISDACNTDDVTRNKVVKYLQMTTTKF
jgi:hypothetical protein